MSESLNPWSACRRLTNTFPSQDKNGDFGFCSSSEHPCLQKPSHMERYLLSDSHRSLGHKLRVMKTLRDRVKTTERLRVQGRGRRACEGSAEKLRIPQVGLYENIWNVRRRLQTSEERDGRTDVKTLSTLITITSGKHQTMLNKQNILVHFKHTDKTSQNTRRIRQQSIIVYACVRKNELDQENRLKTLMYLCLYWIHWI